MQNEPAGIDIHAHAVPRAFLDRVADSRLAAVQVERNGDSYVLTFPGKKPLRPVGGIMLEFNERLDWLDQQDLAQQMVAPWLDIAGQDLPASAGDGWVRLLNDSLAEAVAETGGRLLPHATLHLEDPEIAARELARAASELNMTGAMIPSQLDNGRLAEPRFDALWEAAESLQIPIVIHPPTHAPSNCLFDDFPEATFIGRGIDTTLTGIQLIVTGVFDRFPDLRLVLVHGGGFLPYQTGRFDAEALRGGKSTEESGLKRPPSEYVRTFYYDTTLMSAPALRFLFDLVGAGQVMIGSDYAARPVEHGVDRLIGAIEDTGAGDEVIRQVLRENAARLFRTT